MRWFWFLAIGEYGFRGSAARRRWPPLPNFSAPRPSSRRAVMESTGLCSMRTSPSAGFSASLDLRRENEEEWVVWAFWRCLRRASWRAILSRVVGAEQSPQPAVMLSDGIHGLPVKRQFGGSYGFSRRQLNQGSSREPHLLLQELFTLDGSNGVEVYLHLDSSGVNAK